MKIILMRHGEAEPYRTQDSTRQLTAVGTQQALKTSEYLLDKFKPDLLLVSPYTRAKQTMQAFTKKLQDTPLQVIDGITPEDSAPVGLDLIESAINSFIADDDLNSHKIDLANLTVLVVCHMPIVAKMTSILTGATPESYSLAEARVIECEAIAEYLGVQIDGVIPII